MIALTAAWFSASLAVPALFPVNHRSLKLLPHDQYFEGIRDAISFSQRIIDQ